MIDTPVVRYTDKGKRYAVRSMTFFGFMSLNGKDVVMASESARAFDAVSFLEVVRGENETRPILVVVDNATIHRSKLTRAVARDLDIFFVFLPPYSPDLNPIEFGWKDLKRELAAKLDFDAMNRRERTDRITALRREKENLLRSLDRIIHNGTKMTE